MSSTSPEHKVECFRLAQDRKRHGLTSWAETLDVSTFFHNDRPFKENRDGIVNALKRSRWFKRKSKPVLNNQEYLDVFEGLEQSEDAGEFDGYWNELYYLADYDRVWIKTF